MKQIQLNANIRTEMKKNAMNRLRVKQQVPAVLYGQGKPAVTLQVGEKELGRLLQSSGTNILVKLNIEGEQSPREELCMIRELQRHPVTSRFVHVDFVKVSMDKPLETAIPIILTGIARGLKEGGMIEQVHRELMIRCLPALMPENITLDVTSLGIGEGITVADIKLAEGVEVLVEGHEPVVHVVAPRQVEEEKPAEVAGVVAPEAKQPEVIGEKEREERRTEREKDKK